jgi:alkylhydroperoxidase/carboxymuconolactone decarboxylase family protein YurZ
MKPEHAEGARVYADLRGADRAEDLLALAEGAGAEAVIADLSLAFVFGKVWARGGLDRKQRSLVTIAVLTAFRQTTELQNHLRIGLHERPDPGRTRGSQRPDGALCRVSRRVVGGARPGQPDVRQRGARGPLRRGP